jgi:alkaline phosphatase D
VLYKIDQSGVDCRLVVSTSESLDDPRYSEKVASASSKANIVKLPIDGLEPVTQYFYGLEMDGSLASDGQGTFKTFPAAGQSFAFAFGNSLRDNTPTMSESGLAAALENDLAFFLCTGDYFYEDIGYNNLGKFRSAYRTALRRGPDALMGRTVPFVFMWDDHDYGPNNSDAGANGRPSSRQAYREAIPHYPLPAGDGDKPIYQAFSVGVVRFIVTDLRSERDDNWDRDNDSKSMMGTAQLNWFFDELKSSSATHELIFWVSTVPYTAGEKKGGDHWGGFTTERKKIANFIKQNDIENIMIITGDAHSVAATDGSQSDYADGGGAPIAEILAAPLDGSTSRKGGPWTEGVWTSSSGTAYGHVSVEVGASDITVTFSGRDISHKEHIGLKKTFSRKQPVGIIPPAASPARLSAVPFAVRPVEGGAIRVEPVMPLASPVTLEVFSVSGRLVERALLGASGHTLNLIPGVYNIRWHENKDGAARMERITVR